MLARAKRKSEAECAQFEQGAFRGSYADQNGKMDRDEFYAALSSFMGGGGGGEGVFGSGDSEGVLGYFNSLPEAGPFEVNSNCRLSHCARPRPGRGVTAALVRSRRLCVSAPGHEPRLPLASRHGLLRGRREALRLRRPLLNGEARRRRGIWPGVDKDPSFFSGRRVLGRQLGRLAIGADI